MDKRFTNKKQSLNLFRFGVLSLLSVSQFAHADTPLLSSLNIETEASLIARQDNLVWNIGTTPSDILSELEWKNIKATQAALSTTVRLPYNFVVKGFYAYGNINKGLAYDADYNGQRDDLYLLSQSDINGSLRDMSIELSEDYQLNSNVNTSVEVGWSKHQQQLNMLNGFQLVPSNAPFYGPFKGLNNQYDTQWQGFFLGATLVWLKEANWQFEVSAKHHFWNYEAVADWNLRKEFAHPVSFEHETNAKGYQGDVVIRYNINRQFGIKIFCSVLSARGENGIDVTYFNKGGVQSYFLHQVEWQTRQYGMTLNYQW
jgi:hypothetical protein